MESPTNLGWKMFPSRNCPAKKTPSVASGQVQSGQNCTVATPTESTSPVSEPT